MVLEDEEGLSEYETHVEKNDNNVIVAATAKWCADVLDVLYQFEAVQYDAAHTESCT